VDRERPINSGVWRSVRRLRQSFDSLLRSWAQLHVSLADMDSWEHWYRTAAYLAREVTSTCKTFVDHFRECSNEYDRWSMIAVLQVRFVSLFD